MKLSNREKLVIGLLNSYSMAVRQLYPGETDRQRFNRLVDTLGSTGNKLFEKREDSRYFVANVVQGETTTRVLTVYESDTTGLTADLSLHESFDDELQEEMFMMLFSVMTLAVSVVISRAISELPVSPAVQAVMNRQNMWNAMQPGQQFPQR